MVRSRTEEGKAMLNSARTAIMASPAASAQGAASDAMQEQAARLESFNKAIDKKDSRKAKKEIQYENYRVQKKKQRFVKYNHRGCISEKQPIRLYHEAPTG